MDQVVINRTTSWYFINIKARRNQTPSHYVEAWNQINEQDPMVEMPRATNRFVSVKRMTISSDMDEYQQPKWIQTNLVAYTLIDPEAFYNRRTKEDLRMDWDEDIAANKKETNVYFVPSVHKLAVRKGSEITLNYLLYYLQNAFDRVEPEGFDIDVVKDRNTLEQILSAHSIYSIEAEVSFSNPGHTDGFRGMFEDKLREAGPNRFSMKLVGSRENPLQADEDGFIPAVVNLSEENGSVKAVVQRTEDSAPELIDTEQHPFVYSIPQILRDTCSTIYNTLRTMFNNERN